MIFISYRTADAADVAARLDDSLTAEFGPLNVFRDKTRLEAGQHWPAELELNARSRPVMLVLIGKSWKSATLTEGSHEGYPSLSDPEDWVRKELIIAFDAGHTVIPVFVNGASMPKADWLEGVGLKPLASTQGIDLRTNDYASDFARLVALLRKHCASLPPPKVSGLQISPTRLPRGADHLFGRESELKLLDDAWANPATHVLSIVAWGGVGKTSLAVEWMNRQSAAGWKGSDRVFDWSFYSQGTREQRAASADAFIAKALEFFGDTTTANSPASPWDKGARLAQLVAEHRTLLVLDGLEPLQHPPGSLAGQLKDPAIAQLLKCLARHNPGLCIVTTRERVGDLIPYKRTTAPKLDLHHLSTPAAIELLKSFGLHGSPDEFQRLVTDVKAHALTLNLLGRYLADAHGGDIRKRDLVRFEEADAEEQGGHAFRVISAYEKWLASGDENARCQLAVLRLLGLFDRPANAGCLSALRRPPAIGGLTDSLVGLTEAKWNIALTRLTELGLILIGRSEPWSASADGTTASAEADPTGNAIDAHPLIREYFAKQLCAKHPEGWKNGHERLYRHLCQATEHRPDTLEGLGPLYQAVAHGCQAGLHQEACDKVYFDRVFRGSGPPDGSYSAKKLGAFAANLGATSCFFVKPWRQLAGGLAEPDQAWLLNEAAFSLRALGRLGEALGPMGAALERDVLRRDWKNAAISAGNLSELELTLGEVGRAVGDAERSVGHADQSGDAFQRMSKRAELAGALHQSGRVEEASKLFGEAERMQTEHQPEYPLLYSMQGFRYCDLLLGRPERAAWRRCVKATAPGGNAEEVKCQEVQGRARTALGIVVRGSRNLLDIASNHLTLGRAALYRSILSGSDVGEAEAAIGQAVDGLRRAGQQDYTPHGLLTRAWLRSLRGDGKGAEEDLDEAWEIASRGGMKLFMADVLLHRARLFHTKRPYPWPSDDPAHPLGPKDDLAAARELIESCGYWRRKQELEDAEAAARNW